MSSSTKLYLIAPENIDRIWRRVLPLIDEACKRVGLYTADSVRKWLGGDENGLATWFLFVAVETVDGKEDILGLACVELSDYELARVINVTICTGRDADRWKHHLGEIERWAVERFGVSRCVYTAREGWLRKLDGYKRTHIIMEKDLRHAEQV